MASRSDCDGKECAVTVILYLFSYADGALVCIYRVLGVQWPEAERSFGKWSPTRLLTSKGFGMFLNVACAQYWHSRRQGAQYANISRISSEIRPLQIPASFAADPHTPLRILLRKSRVRSRKHR